MSKDVTTHVWFGAPAFCESFAGLAAILLLAIDCRREDRNEKRGLAK